ncbi:hypothetical protein GQR58_010671 [Nymphon striatum]|nr:hypothetical protein GQR58_010671 [Nymphon striatum]
MLTGELLWDLDASMTSSNPLTSSVPGGVRILDVNRNGLIDRMYFADTGGNVWRLDLSESLSMTGDSESKLTKLASLGGSGSSSRKFYNEPDVATMSPDGKTIFAVSIGSGYRAHPQDKTIADKLFVLRDTSPYHELDSDFTPITIDKLASVSISSGDSISLTQSGFDDSDKDKGWYLSFPANSGEKVLATAVTFDGVITFTSMVPQVVTDNVDVCKAPVSEGRFYAMNILTGEAGLNLDESEESNAEDRVTDSDIYITVVKGEIPGKPQIVFNAITKEVKTNGEGTVTKATCSHPVDIRNGKKLSQVTGYDACKLESVYWNDPMLTVSAAPEAPDGKIFKCTNKQGEVYYNDKPCPVEDDEKRIRSENDVINGYVPPGYKKEQLKQRVGVSVGGNSDKELGGLPHGSLGSSSTSQSGGSSSGSNSGSSGGYDVSMKSATDTGLKGSVVSPPKAKIKKSAPGEKFSIQEKKSMLGISPQVK